MWETICDAVASWSGWKFGSKFLECPKYFRNVGLEYPSSENENLGRSWHFEFEFELFWRSYVETNRCIPRGYHLVISVLWDNFASNWTHATKLGTPLFGIGRHWEAPLRCPLYSELQTANCSLLFFLNQEVLNLLSKLSKPLTPPPPPNTTPIPGYVICEFCSLFYFTL